MVPNVPELARREYGARVGVFRLMEIFDRLQIPVTAALNSDVCLAYPEIIKAGNERGWEWMGHNESNSIRLNGATVDQRSVISRTLRVIEDVCGTRAAGWLSSGLQENWETLPALAGAGIDYVADWVADDRPFWLLADRETGRRLVSVPYSLVLNDKPAVEAGKALPWEFGAMIKHQFDVLYREGAESGRVMAIALHPYISGQPYFYDALYDALAYVASHRHVWMTQGHEIASHFAGNCPGNSP